MNFLRKMERRFGKYALHDLPVIVIALYAAGYIMSLISPNFLNYCRLDPEAIFLKKETGMVCFCYYPAKAGTFQQAFQAMMEWFMRKLNPVDEEDVLLLYRLYQRSRENDMTIKEPAAIWKEAKLNRAEEEKEDAGNEASFIRADNSFDREPADEKSRLLLDLGIQLPVKETSFSRWKKRNGLPEETEEVPAPDVEIAGAEDMYTMKDRLSVFMQNNKTEAVIFTVLALIIVYLLVN